MLSKLVGGGVFILGILITIAFPGVGPTHQPTGMSWAGVLVGIALMGAGIWILKT